MGQEGAYLELTMVRGEDREYVFVYRPRDRSLPPFNLTGKTLEMRIQPKGQALITYNASPGIYISDAAGGEFRINPSGSMKSAYQFQNASYAVLLDGKRLLYGPLTVKYLYE